MLALKSQLSIANQMGYGDKLRSVLKMESPSGILALTHPSGSRLLPMQLTPIECNAGKEPRGGVIPTVFGMQLMATLMVPQQPCWLPSNCRDLLSRLLPHARLVSSLDYTEGSYQLCYQTENVRGE